MLHIFYNYVPEYMLYSTSKVLTSCKCMIGAGAWLHQLIVSEQGGGVLHNTLFQ